MTIYQLGQWGETRTDGVQVAAGQTTTPTAPQFIPENFSTAGNSPIWTIGTPDRSSHEFLNGSNDSYTYSNGNVTGTPVTNNGVTPGGDFREYYGNYNYWQEEANLGHNGYVSYYATAVGSTPATNNPLDWIANQWGKFDPGIYDPVNDTTDGYTNTNGYVPPNGTQPAYVAAGGGAATYGGAPWQVNFTTTAAQSAQGQYVVLSVGLAGNEGSLTISLNGHSETWHYGATTSDPMVRSGVAGTYEMLVYQWPVSDLSAAGTQDQFTFSVSQTDGVMYDALRMEITNTAATPNTTGWHDYAYITGSNTQTNPDNVLPTDPPTWNLNGGGTWATSGNWLFGVPNAAGATAFLASGPGITASSTITLNANETLGALVLNNTVGGSSNSYTLAQSGGVGGLIFSNGTAQALIDDEAGNHLIGVPITLNSDLSVSVATSTNTLTISNVISGTGRLLVSGAGAVMLSGNNTYTGDTAVNSGTLNLASAGHIVSSNILVAASATFADAGTMSASTNLTDNGTITITAPTPTVATLNGSGALNLNSSAVLTISSAGTLSGVAAGNGGITVSGGALKLSAANTYTGATNITGGSLELVSPGALATSSISVSSGAGFTVDSGATISSAPSLTDTGTATFKNTADTVAALNGAGTLNLTPTALTVTNGGSFSGLIASSGSLTVSGGALILSHADTFSGATAVTGGSLEIASPGSIASTTVSASSGATLTIDSGASIPSTTNLTDNGTASFKNTAQSIATLNGSGTLNLNPTALTISNGGTFSGPINGPGTLTASFGTLNLSGSLGASTVTVNSSATLNINGSVAATAALVSNGLTNFAANIGVAGPLPVALASVHIGAAGVVTVNSSTLHANRTVLEVGSLTFANVPAIPQGLLNLNDNDLIVHGGNLADITSEIAAAFDEGAWDGGAGITSSAAAAAKNTTLAAVLNDNETGTHTPLYTTFDGQSVVDSDVLVKYTFFGDATFQGVVDAADYVAIDNGFNSQSSANPLTGWQNGDFNGDGVINGDDYTLIDNAYNSQGSVSYAADSAGPTEMIATDTAQIAAMSSTAVPEPGSLTLASVLTCGLLARRRR
jgi:autotransporter-associated beta strand protein